MPIVVTADTDLVHRGLEPPITIENCRAIMLGLVQVLTTVTLEAATRWSSEPRLLRYAAHRCREPQRD